MAKRSGRRNILVGQTGEYLVAAELSRQGLIATTFTGNVPHYDIIASDEAGRHVSVQVKSSRSETWQFSNVGQFYEVKFKGKRQIVGDKKACPVRHLVVVFVKVGEYGNDRFYILSWQRLRDILIKGHKEYLARHRGVRPKRWDSLHGAIYEKILLRYRDRWETVFKNLK